MAEFHKVADVNEIPEGGMKAFEVDDVPVVICNVDGKYFAVADECTHDSGPIHSGRICDNEIICPRHHARFSVENGAVIAPPAVVPLDTYKVKVENGHIYVRIE
ncbi:MAG: non-heme iron oxygenase ferredoxin subunit [candidate division Zixibacteria bacterium]|nr:non-heme iron oxygenase ferredoxin subunit [candidate division Zixibacteria bacterium]